jgi:hypothetical protein
MFNLIADPTFRATVKIPAPGGESLDLRVVFRHRTRDELKAYWADATDGKLDDLRATMDILVGWFDVEDEFCEENVIILLQNYHGAAAALFQAYLEELTRARLGN